MGGPGSFNGTGNPNWKDPITGKTRSGNPAGAPKKADSLANILKEIGEKTKNIKGSKKKVTYRHMLAERMWQLAIQKGDANIIKQIFDRLEGPVTNVTKILNQQEAIDEATLRMRDFIKHDLIRTKQFVHPWYKPAWYHRKLANLLMDENELKLIIVIPPQHGKSELVTKTFPAWYLAQNPNNGIILGSYNNTYAEELSVKARDFFLNPSFSMLFPDLELHPEQQTKHKWALSGHEGQAIFAGVGGTITGNPADIFLVDDLDKDFEDACSKVQQEKKWNWVKSVMDTRLRGDRSRQIIVTTRFVKNDVVGKIQAYEERENIPPEKRFKVVHCPAILDVQNDDYTKGRPLWPEVKSLDFLLERQRKDPAMFKAVWMGNPKDLEGQVIKPEWIKIEDDVKSLGKLIGSARGWDFGYTETGDETVGARVDVYENGEDMTCVLSSIARCRKDPNLVRELVVNTALADGPNVVIAVEGGGTQIAMAKAIAKRKELMDYKVISIVPKGDKISRAMPWILKVEDGMFRLLRGPWNEEVKQYMADFGEGCDHDDLIDAITNAWKALFGVKE